MAHHRHNPWPRWSGSTMKWAFLLLRLSLGAVFLYAGLVKASSSSQFALALVPFTILPPSWLGPLALILPWLEITAGILVITGPKKFGAALILSLCLSFIALLGWALANEIIVACSCFGRDETPSKEKMMLAMGRDIVLALMAAAVFCENWIRRRKPQTPSP